MKVLVVGSGGLIGAGVTQSLETRAHSVFRARSVPWHDPDLATSALVREGRAFFAQADGPWAIVWCAGSGVTQSSERHFEAELETLTNTLSQLCPTVASNDHPGALVVLSSAGGIYGGSIDPPFTERSKASPLGAYGIHKLRSEEAVAKAAYVWGVPAGSARLSNVYGPGQDLAKPQGLITRLCLSALRNEPFTVYVPLDTSRDYIYVHDAATRVTRFVEHVHSSRTSGLEIKLIASGTGRSIAAVIGECQTLPSLRPLVVQRSSSLSMLQARDLRFRSVVAREIDRGPLTPMPTGIAATAEDLAKRIARGDLRRNLRNSVP